MTTPPPTMDKDDAVERVPLRERVGIALIEVGIYPRGNQVGYSRDDFLRAADAAIASLSTNNPEHMPGAVEQAATALVAKLDACSEEIQGAFLWREMKCGPYTGPTYEAELAALRTALMANARGTTLQSTFAGEK